MRLKYNAAFFGLYENLFIVLKKEFGAKKALRIFRLVMEKGLQSAYNKMGFEKGKPSEFVRVVRARDQSVGLKVRFPVVQKNKIVYQFWTDPFPNLKGKVKAKELVSTFMEFKVSYLLGKGWKYRTTKHLWLGDSCIEYVIEKTKM